MNEFPFIFSRKETGPIPLEKYLPKYQTGIISHWLEEHTTPNGLILSPFGTSPQAILEGARAGYRFLVPAHNPIIRFVIDRLSRPVPKEVMNTSLVHLGSSYKADQRIKPLILSLYETECPQCGGQTTASSFIWSRERGEPIQKTCRCSNCGEDTNGDVSAADISRAGKFQTNSPTYARALTRVAAPDDPIRLQVEIALRSYPPRAVYALFTLLNKITGMDNITDQRKHLEMLLLHAFYRSSSPETRILAENTVETDQDDLYREENIWFSLEEALDIWFLDQKEIPVLSWPQLPPESGGITLFTGRIRDLIPDLPELPITAVSLVYPQPRLSFWALSALWTGWLWGQEAAAPFRNILSVRKYDWEWLTRAIYLTLSELKKVLPLDIPYLGLLPELNENYLIAALSATSHAGFSLNELAIEPEQKISITTWHQVSSSDEEKKSKNDRQIIRQAGLDLLTKTGEPEHTLTLYGAGLAALNIKGSLEKSPPNQDPEVYFPQLVKDFEENIAYRQGFLHYPKCESWWHQDLSISPTPKTDQVEQSLVNLLVNSDTPLSEEEIFHHLYQEYPSLLTPRIGLIKACLDSYGEVIATNPRTWQLKESDHPSERINDLEHIKAILHDIGENLGFSIAEKPPLGKIVHLTWGTEVSDHFHFFISASCLINKIVVQFNELKNNAWIILPGSRAILVFYKMSLNPLLDERIREDFGLLKFRHLRRLAEQGGLTHANLQERLSLDPFTSESPQLPLI